MCVSVCVSVCVCECVCVCVCVCVSTDHLYDVHFRWDPQLVEEGGKVLLHLNTVVFQL